MISTSAAGCPESVQIHEDQGNCLVVSVVTIQNDSPHTSSCNLNTAQHHWLKIHTGRDCAGDSKDEIVLESVPRTLTGTVSVLEDFSYEARLDSLGLQ